MKKLAANLALLFASLLVTAWVLDLFLVLLPPRDYMARRTELRQQAARNAGIASFDPRSQSEVARDLRDSGTDAWPSVSGLNVIQTTPEDVDTLFPLSGIARVPTVLCGELGVPVIYQADRHGFRNPDSAWAAPRVVLIGDSFAAGMCVGEAVTAGGVLRAGGVPALTIGYRGADPLTELGQLREFVAPLRPPLVLWLYFEGNDLEEPFEPGREPLRRYLDPAFRQHLAARQAETDTLLRNWVLREEARHDSAVARFRPEPWPRTAAKVIKLYHLRQLAARAAARPKRTAPPGPDLMDTVLTRARDEVRAWGGELKVVYLPAAHAFGARGLEDVPGVRLYEEMRSRICRLQLPLLDLRRRLTARPDADSLWPSPAFDGIHFNERGYRAFGEELAGFVSARVNDCA